MGIKQFKNHQSALSLALCLGLVLLPGTSRQAQATLEKTTTTVRNTTTSVESLLEINFEPSDENGESQPEESLGAGSRNGRQCGSETDRKPLTLLVPATTVPLTITSHPTFLVYFPKTVAKEAELSLRDDRGNGVYQTTFMLNDTAGIMRIQLPETAPPLEIGQNYQWSIAMICDRDDRLRDEVADGWIKRMEITPQLDRQLENASTIEQVAIYGSLGIWYETVSTLAQLWVDAENSNPIAIANAWKQLLTNETVKLEPMSEIDLLHKIR